MYVKSAHVFRYSKYACMIRFIPDCTVDNSTVRNFLNFFKEAYHISVSLCHSLSRGVLLEVYVALNGYTGDVVLMCT